MSTGWRKSARPSDLPPCGGAVRSFDKLRTEGARRNDIVTIPPSQQILKGGLRPMRDRDSTCLFREPTVPGVLAAVEDVQVDAAIDPVRKAGPRILPEHPLLLRIRFGGMRCHRAKPKGMFLELPSEVVVIEIGAGVDDGPLTVVFLQLVHEDLHFLQHECARRTPFAGPGVSVPFDIDDRRNGAFHFRNVANEPIRLFAGGSAPVEEMVGASSYASRAGRAPVTLEHGVKVIAAVRRFDVDEVRPLGAKLGPVNVALP